MITVSGLCKRYGRHIVLDGVDLEVPAGSLTAVLGPSGSGKTTLLRILAGFQRPDGGRVQLGGTTVEEAGRVHVPPERRRVGYVPQEGALFPHLSAAGNVAFGLPHRERRGPRPGELLALVGLAGFDDRYPHQLSGGQQQRVALARALAVRPEIVLLDEPFSSLDAALRAEVRQDVARVLARTGTTAVLVTHDQDEALSLADQVAVLRDGRVAQCATPETLYRCPVDPAMAGFVGDANLLDGLVGDGRVATLLGELALVGGPAVLGDGVRAIVLVRPEQVRLDDSPDAPGSPARVEAVEYHGHDAVVTLQATGAPGPRLLARVPGAPAVKPGLVLRASATGPVVAWRHEGAEQPVPVPGTGTAGPAGSDGWPRAGGM